MVVTSFQMRTRRDQEPASPPTILLEWSRTIQVRQSLTWKLVPPDVAIDFLRFAAAVYCADRVSVRPGTWTRSIELQFPARHPDVWQGTVSNLAGTLGFLTGDQWTLSVVPSSEPGRMGQPPTESVDAVCLFSGGLDSFTGAVDLLATGKTVCLVAHYEGGQAPEAQSFVVGKLQRRFGNDRVIFRHLFLRPAAPGAGQTRPLPADREASMRSRSLLFLAAGLAVAAGYGPEVPLFIPENGFIGINVPLTAARSGSLSTRTTHPYFMASVSDCARRLGIPNPIINPFRLMTKSEILTSCRDQEAIRGLARNTLSCAHPEASRYAKRKQGNCGYCFPCLIRRSALYQAGLDNPIDYAYNALRDDYEMSEGKGSDLRALIRSLNRASLPVDVLRNGPVPAQDVQAFAGVYQRGRREILAWMNDSNPSRLVRRQLPRL
jgi:7-cyano-7-deazaguanine synthase in queuosine biosynthesis